MQADNAPSYCIDLWPSNTCSINSRRSTTDGKRSTAGHPQRGMQRVGLMMLPSTESSWLLARTTALHWTAAVFNCLTVQRTGRTVHCIVGHSVADRWANVMSFSFAVCTSAQHKHYKPSCIKRNYSTYTEWHQLRPASVGYKL